MNLHPLEIVPTSAQTGRGIEALRGAIERLARSLPESAHTARAFLPIDRVFNVKGAGVVVTGTLTRGRLTAGQELRVHGRTVRRRALAGAFRFTDARRNSSTRRRALP